MKVTKLLVAHLVTLGLSQDADEGQVKEFATARLLDNSLSTAKLAELTADEDAKAGNALLEAIKSLTEQSKATAERLDKLEAGKSAPPAPATAPQPAPVKAPDLNIAGLIVKAGGDGGFDAVRVKGVEERFSTTKSEAHFPATTVKGRRHPFAGQRCFEGGGDGVRYIDHPSDLDRAVAGAYAKWSIYRSAGGQVPANMRMTEQDSELIQYALHNMKWGGVIRGDDSAMEGAIGVNNAKLSGDQIKSVLDDATSGGIEIAPIVFDDMIIMTPLLYGEFFPQVNVVNITRGRRVEGGTMANVTLTSGGADDTDVPLFTTTSFIAAFDTNIFVCNGSIEIGLDFASDSPIPVADRVVQTYGQVLLAWLDEQICVGDGTTEPEGIMNASGTTSVSHSSAAPTVGGYESLMFGVPKAYKQGYTNDRLMFGGNETSYQRMRAISVSGSDARRIFGMDHGSYRCFDHNYGINESMANTQLFFANLGRYRMYRRLGLTIKTTMEGKTLVRGNKMLIVARARYGGQLEDGAAAAVCTNAQA